MESASDRVYFNRHIHLELNPAGRYEPTFCAEAVSDGRYDFETNTNQLPPTEDELVRYPADFISYITAWISDVTKRLWQRRYGRRPIQEAE